MCHTHPSFCLCFATYVLHRCVSVFFLSMFLDLCSPSLCFCFLSVHVSRPMFSIAVFLFSFCLCSRPMFFITVFLFSFCLCFSTYSIVVCVFLFLFFPKYLILMALCSLRFFSFSWSVLSISCRYKRLSSKMLSSRFSCVVAWFSNRLFDSRLQILKYSSLSASALSGHLHSGLPDF
jgi:hypothetical protein